MATGVISFSTTAATNSAADSAINFAEGQAPSSLNDSCRALMASVAKWRDDISGTITTGGTATAYTVTSNQGYSLTSGYMIAFVPHATNTGTVTMNVDSLGAKPLRGEPGVELSSGSLILGTPYVATYKTSNSGEWIVHGAANNYGVPLGGMIPFVGTTAPNSCFVLPYGQAISRTTYAALFTITSTTYGVGDGSTTFNLPDIRGRVIAGYDSMGGSSANRLTNLTGGLNGDTVGATGGEEAHTLLAAGMPVHTHTATSVVTDPTHQHSTTSVTTLYKAEIQAANAGFAVTTGSIGSGFASTGVTVATTNANAGSGSAHNNVQPTIILPYIMRVL